MLEACASIVRLPRIRSDAINKRSTGSCMRRIVQARGDTSPCMSSVLSTGCLEHSFSSNATLFQWRKANGKDVRAEWIPTAEVSSIWDVYNCVFLVSRDPTVCLT